MEQFSGLILSRCIHSCLSTYAGHHSSKSTTCPNPPKPSEQRRLGHPCPWSWGPFLCVQLSPTDSVSRCQSSLRQLQISNGSSSPQNKSIPPQSNCNLSFIMWQWKEFDRGESERRSKDWMIGWTGRLTDNSPGPVLGTGEAWSSGSSISPLLAVIKV